MHLQVVPALFGENGELIKAYPMANATAILTRVNIGLVCPPAHDLGHHAALLGICVTLAIGVSLWRRSWMNEGQSDRYCDR
jgi:hypothetical protein